MTFGISQVETVCPKLVDHHSIQIQAALNQKEMDRLAFVVLMLTDVLKKKTCLFCSDNGKKYVDTVFGKPEKFYLPLENTVSRKLQIVPQLFDFIRKNESL